MSERPAALQGGDESEHCRRLWSPNRSEGLNPLATNARTPATPGWLANRLLPLFLPRYHHLHRQTPPRPATVIASPAFTVSPDPSCRARQSRPAAFASSPAQQRAPHARFRAAMRVSAHTTRDFARPPRHSHAPIRLPNQVNPLIIKGIAPQLPPRARPLHTYLLLYHHSWSTPRNPGPVGGPKWTS